MEIIWNIRVTFSKIISKKIDFFAVHKNVIQENHLKHQR